MVNTGQSTIRRVRFLPPAPGVGAIEANTLRGIRDRGGPEEFLTPQRLDFDLLMQVTSGTAGHTVDFTEHSLRPGDILWVRAGQVHQWGAIADIEGSVVMFGPHSMGESIHDLLRSHVALGQSHWSAADLAGTPVTQILDLLTSGTDSPRAEQSDLREAARAQLLAALLIELALARAAGRAPTVEPTHQVFSWFRDHIEEHFRTWHKVSEYADRLGYSSRTLNRLARQHTGLSAKELIDERVLLEAKRQLAHRDAPVSEIAEQLGFDDASNFSSYFRRQTRTTPGAFRSRSRTGTATASACMHG